MLTMYLRCPTEKSEDIVPSNMRIVSDVESAFSEVDIPITDTNRLLVQLIDKGDLYNRSYFTDRFGTQLYLDCLSTGCKAALLVNNTDYVIDLIECRLNARDIIVSCCKNGNVVLDDPDITFNEVDGFDRIDVFTEGKTFHTVKDLNRYVFLECMAD